MSDSYVDSFTHLKDMPKADRALPQLRRIASLVKPIMRKHGWRLPTLAEFFPSNPALVGLNVNAGRKILLRLRPAWDPDTFYEEEQLVAVLLHELTHNVHGPHDEKFYKFLSGLEDEYYELKRTGYAGEGFYSPGFRVGTGVSHNLPPHLARLKAAEAAERRIQVSGVLNGGGRKLGGVLTAPGGGLSLRELTAQAAERRIQDETSCGTLHGQDVSSWDAGPSRGPENIPWSCPRCTLVNKPSFLQCEVCFLERPQKQGPPPTVNLKTKPVLQKRRTPPPPLRSKRPRVDISGSINTTNGREETLPMNSNGWACPTCTLINTPLALQCSACVATRPGTMMSSDGWTCHACGAFGNTHDFWSCQVCGSIKQTSSVS